MSDIGPPRKEPPPSELRIGAPPRPVTRLSRRTLVVAGRHSPRPGTHLRGALVRPGHPTAAFRKPGTLQYQRQARRCVRQYARQLRRYHSTKTGTFAAPAGPATGAASAGDLGRPMLQQQTGTPTPTADPEAERRRQEREQAAASVVFFTVSVTPAGLAGVSPGQPAESGASVPSLEGAGPQTSADDLSIQNSQSHKEGFLNARPRKKLTANLTANAPAIAAPRTPSMSAR
jgi:hypothetical protein